jgi:hypothetical protein
MTLDLSREALSRRIDTLRSGYETYSEDVRTRNATYLRLFSPKYDSNLKEHDQWPDDFKAVNVNHARSSYNITRAVVELWTALEAYPLPNIKWTEAFIPPPIPDIDPQVHAAREQTQRAKRLVAQQVATRREQALDRPIVSAGWTATTTAGSCARTCTATRGSQVRSRMRPSSGSSTAPPTTLRRCTRSGRAGTRPNSPPSCA